MLNDHVDSKATKQPESDNGSLFAVEEISLDLRTAKLKIAMIQLEGPLPTGKTIIAAHGRETFEWQSLQEIRKRQAKAELILDFLGEHHPDTDIVVFPEYSLPVIELFPMLRKKADKYNQIIVGGADNIRQEDRKTILNQCPIIIPHKGEIWINKRHLSQWENQYVDEPLRISNPVMTWEAQGHKYWMTVHICLDFTYITQDPLRGIKDPVIHIVPMCSPDNHTFRTYADTTLLEEGGRATLLCNCVGDKWAGASSLFAVTPTGVRLLPAYELTSNKEGFAFLEVDCSNLTLPKRSTKNTKSPLSRIHIYNLESSGEDFQISHVAIKQNEDQKKAIGVINPYLFKQYAKRMLLTFINVAKYGAMKEEDVQRQGFECYSVLGHHDMMITHLHQDPNDLFFGIREMMGWNPSSVDRTDMGAIDDGDTARYSYFEVFTYHKVLGIKIGPAHRTAFRDEPPTSEELSQILALGKNWNDENILDDVRELLVSKRWILGSTAKEPGNIDAVMTIYLDHPEDLRVPMQIFEDYVLPKLMENTSITSIYEGTGRKMSIHYVLRITGSKDNLFTFIQDVHKLAIEARLMIMTNTFVIVKKWGSLDLEKSLLVPVLPPNEEAYRNDHIVNRLSTEEKVKFIGLPREYQLNFIETYREFEKNLYILNKYLKLNQQPQDMQRDMVIGLFNEDFTVLRHPHDELQGHVESWIRKHTSAVVTGEEFVGIRDKVGIQKGKTTKDKLTYAEWLLISIYCAEQGLIDSDLLGDLRQLLETTTHVRNAIKHDEWGKLSTKLFLTALSSYFSFLLHLGQRINV